MYSNICEDTFSEGLKSIIYEEKIFFITSKGNPMGHTFVGTFLFCFCLMSAWHFLLVDKFECTYFMLFS